MKNSPLDATDLTWLAGLARALIGESHADDLVQDTAVAAIRRPAPDGVPRRAWLSSVARRLAARQFRGDSRRAKRERAVARSNSLPDSTELVERAEVAEQVTSAARRLPEPFRRTILLRFLDGRSTEDIARDEGKPMDTVRWRVRRGLELLREQLQRENGRDWSSWCVLLTPLARSGQDIGLATAGAAGVSAGTVASLALMKTTVFAAATALGSVLLWFGWNSQPDNETAALVSVRSAGEPAVTSSLVSDTDTAPARTEVTDSPAALDPVREPATVTPGLFGVVVDEAGQPIDGATAYLVASDKSVPTRTQTDPYGSFRISEPVESDDSLELGVSANGYLRTVVSATPSSEAMQIVLRRGRELRGRVIDEIGRPVIGLPLVLCTAYAGVSHVSPSQRAMRARKRELAGTNSTYQQCFAETDGAGNVEFAGLPDGKLQVFPVAPGWTIEGSNVSADDGFVTWTAKRQLGVQLTVVDRVTGRKVEEAGATFCIELTFADGEILPLEQWVGRGPGEVSFVMDSELVPGLEDRTITRATFYGTAGTEESKPVKWRAEPIEGSPEALGVAEVRVEVDAYEKSIDPREIKSAEQKTLPKATLELDVRYEDGTLFNGELRVEWSARPESRPTEIVKDNDLVDPVRPGRYRVEVVAGDVTVEIRPRGSSGTLPRWRERVRCFSERPALAFMTMRRGATAKIMRPDDWTGTWHVRASYRESSDAEWFGSWGYGTDGESLTLGFMQPAEWRFELRRDSAVEADPLVRTAELRAGETTVVPD